MLTVSPLLVTRKYWSRNSATRPSIAWNVPSISIIMDANTIHPVQADGSGSRRDPCRGTDEVERVVSVMAIPPVVVLLRPALPCDAWCASSALGDSCAG